MFVARPISFVLDSPRGVCWIVCENERACVPRTTLVSDTTRWSFRSCPRSTVGPSRSTIVPATSYVAGNDLCSSPLHGRHVIRVAPWTPSFESARTYCAWTPSRPSLRSSKLPSPPPPNAWLCVLFIAWVVGVEGIPSNRSDPGSPPTLSIPVRSRSNPPHRPFASYLSFPIRPNRDPMGGEGSLVPSPPTGSVPRVVGSSGSGPLVGLGARGKDRSDVPGPSSPPPRKHQVAASDWSTWHPFSPVPCARGAGWRAGRPACRPPTRLEGGGRLGHEGRWRRQRSRRPQRHGSTRRSTRNDPEPPWMRKPRERILANTCSSS